MYALLLQNSMAKQTWKQYGFAKTDEQVNAIFAVMLYIMEQSLREESCTMDDIGAYIDNCMFNISCGMYLSCSRIALILVCCGCENQPRNRLPIFRFCPSTGYGVSNTVMQMARDIRISCT